MTLDGKIATYTNESKWITGDLARKYVHKLRHRCWNYGYKNNLADNPSLTARLDDVKALDPIRIIVIAVLEFLLMQRC